MPRIPEFQPGRSADCAHRSLRRSVEIIDRAQHCAVLWFGEIMARRLYRDLGYSTMRAYAMEELGFSSTRVGDFMRLAEKLDRLPVLKEELVTGRLGYSKALAIIPVADAENEKAWVAVAKAQPRAVVRREVRRARAEQKDDPAQGELVPRAVGPAAARTVAVTFELSPGQAARYEAMLTKIGHRGNKAELLLAMTEALLAEKCAEPEVARRRAITAPPYQVHVHRCPDCAEARVATPQGERALSPAEFETACCDAEIHEPGKRNKATIPPRIRREVLTRDRHRCRRKGCRHTRFLHLHHVVPRAEGGATDAENLVTLCTACHDLWHQRGGDLRSLLTDPKNDDGFFPPGR